MFIHLQHCSQYFTSFQACLTSKRITNVQQLWERHGDNAIKVCPIFSRLEPVDLANCQQTLYTGKDGCNVSRRQQLYSDVEEIRPFGGEVVCENLLQGRNQLYADLGRRSDEDRYKAVAEGSLLLLWYRLGLAVLFGRRPALGDAILEVYDGYRLASAGTGGGHLGLGGAFLLDNRTALSCSTSRIFSRPSVNPGFSSACLTVSGQSQAGCAAAAAGRLCTHMLEIQLGLLANGCVRVQSRLDAVPQTSYVHGCYGD